MEKISYIEKDEQGKQHADEFQELIKTATFENMVDPKLLKYLSPVEIKNLRRWVNQFIKANQENDDKNMLAYPFQNKIVRRAIDKLERARLAEQKELIAQGIKSELNKKAVQSEK